MSAELGTQKKEPLLAPLPTNIKYLMENFKKIRTHFRYALQSQRKTVGFEVLLSGDGGIRTHVPVKAKRFRVVLVMTTSIRLQKQTI